MSFDVLWRDRGAAKGMQDLGRHTERAAKGFHALKVGAGIALVAAGAAAVKFGTSSVKAYVEAQTAQVKLQDAFRKFPKLADTNISSLRKLNTQLALKTKFDDDATASGQAVLAQFGLTGQQLTKITPLLQDYAAKTGKDLPQAATALGKAFLGNTKSLKAIGIDYKSTGDKAKDFQNIQRLVNEKVGGFATREGKTAAGQAAILKNQFGELQEAAGKQLLPALLKLGSGLLKIIGFVQSNSATFKTLGKTIKIVFGSIGESIGLGKGSFKDFSDFVATHQADITSAIITGGKGFVKFGLVVAKVASAGLRGFGALADGIGTAVSSILDQYADMAHGAALAFGWIPGIGAKLLGADAKFRVFATRAHNNINKVGDGARSAADGIDKKLVPGLRIAGRYLDDYGKKSVTAAQKRDILAKSEIRHRRALDDATTAAKTNGRTMDRNTAAGWANRNALTKLVGTSQAYIQKLNTTGASSKTVTARTRDARDEFVKVARSMGVSRDRARELADRYFKLPKKVRTDVAQPGMSRSLTDANKYDFRLDHIKKTVKTGVAVRFSSSGSVSLNVGSHKYIANATGGVMPGFTPGRDVHTFQSTSPGVPNLKLSGGEAIMRPEWTRAVGGPPAVARMNQDAKRGKAVGFASGGTVPSMRPATYAPQVAEQAGAAIARGAAKAVSAGALGALKKAAAAAAAKAAAAAAKASGGSGGTGGGRGVSGGILGIVHKYGASASPHRDPQGGRAYDIFGSKRRTIANALRGSHGRLGLRYVISNMQIASARSGWGWRRYSPITHSGDYGHWRHTHVSYDKGGLLRPGQSATNVRGGNERVLTQRQNASFERLVRMVSAGGGGGSKIEYHIHAPNYIGSRDELRQTLVEMNRRGQLEVIKR